MKRTLVALALLSAVLFAACTSTSSTTTSPSSTAPRAGASSSVPPSVVATETSIPVEDPVESARRAELEELMAITAQLRQLPWLSDPIVTFVSTDELAQRVRQQIIDDLDPVDVATDEDVWRLLGLYGVDRDLQSLYGDLYGESVLGYYDFEAKEIVVPVQEEAFSPLEKVTIVHELVHALTDQHFDYGTLNIELSDEQRYDESAAWSALTEGDATFTELLYLPTLSVPEQLQMLEESFGQDTSVYESSPGWLQEWLLWPYDTGNTFVAELVNSGGFGALDQAYRAGPDSTEQILDLERHAAGELPLSVDLPDLELEGYELYEDSTWGQAGFEIMLAQAGLRSSRPSEGWGGDNYQVLRNGDEVVMVLSYRGDQVGDALELFEALGEYVPRMMSVGDGDPEGDELLWEGDDLAFLRVSADTVLFLAASDPKAGLAVLDQVPAEEPPAP